MHTTGLKEFDHTVHNTNIWLKDLMEEMGWQDRHRAYHALRAVLHALRDRLPPETVLHLGSQLPMLIRGFYMEGYRLIDKPLLERSEAEFIGHIQDAFQLEYENSPREITMAVFAVLSRHVSAGEISDVKATLPRSIRKLWQ